MRTRLLLPIALLLLAWLLPGRTEPDGPAAALLELNHASEAQLDGLKGIGPATSRRILAARAERPFDSWQDFQARTRGIGPAVARQLSLQGLRVQGQAFAPSPPPQR